MVRRYAMRCPGSGCGPRDRGFPPPSPRDRAGRGALTPGPLRAGAPDARPYAGSSAGPLTARPLTMRPIGGDDRTSQPSEAAPPGQ
jgi:hypothetical protein